MTSETPSIGETLGDRLARIDQTWKEIGQRPRPLRNMIFVRTEKLPQYYGKGARQIFIPPAFRGNYHGMAHTVFMRALVLAVGPTAYLKVGDRVAFSRLFFARWHEMEDGTLVGWVKKRTFKPSTETTS